MAKRFSGDVRMTVAHVKEDTYEVSLKAPGNKPVDGGVCIEGGYTDLHGAEEAIDEAAIQYLKLLASEGSLLLKRVATNSDGTFHVGRSKSARWPGGLSNTKTKKGRDFAS
jgi:hypothetical protein